ncbi:MAG: thioesterase family protein [Blastocatellia bacterium]|nr:thioesterase family protein [Blastocatellia bacterium]MCS7156525.1 thioesterase family protein [Blastocatellia bacterium]MCX7751734.1 thioesterase family protein [Blastocatellia bacterium]MDW8168835.1 thioesterase family protein [Acidobacteriota bacterium]MDW8257451.1 thioesterase family protein [Acidobacteriota bacterium]
MNIPLGASGTKTWTVTRELTIARLDARLPEAFATPMMIYLMEIAAAEAIQPYLPSGWISVGVSVSVRHLAATPTGMRVTARAEVIAVDERTVTFAIEAYDEREKIGEGTHVRAPVELARFLQRLTQKAGTSGEGFREDHAESA